MSAHPDNGVSEANALKLMRLQAQVEAMRAVLTRLLQDVLVAENRLDNARAAQLLAANEELVVAAIRSQTDAEAAARALSELSTWAERDALTRLPNRILLLDRMETAIAQARRREGSLALLFVDLDHFKNINDTLGHRVGDDVLKEAARCLLASVREADTVSRHGGDEFLILLPDVTGVADALLVADKALAALATPKKVGEHLLQIGASIGVSLYPAHGHDATTLIDRADSAMYRAKNHGLGRCVYEPDVAAPAATAADDADHGTKRVRPPGEPDDFSAIESDRRSAEIQEANQHLLLAALTAQDLRDASEAACRRQNELLALLSHALRQPLTPLRAVASMLAGVRPGKPLLAQARDIIDRQTGHMARLIDDLFDLVRARLVRLGVDVAPIDLAGVVDDAALATRSERESRRQGLVVRVPAGVWTVAGERLRLVLVATPLLANASKFTPDGGRIELSLELVAGRIELTVRDNGIGIGAELLPRIFDPVVRDANATGFNGERGSGGSAGSGVGIGLAVVRELVLGHGGTVVASSDGQGKGSQFVVSLPALAAD